MSSHDLTSLIVYPTPTAPRWCLLKTMSSSTWQSWPWRWTTSTHWGSFTETSNQRSEFVALSNYYPYMHCIGLWRCVPYYLLLQLCVGGGEVLIALKYSDSYTHSITVITVYVATYTTCTVTRVHPHTHTHTHTSSILLDAEGHIKLTGRLEHSHCWHWFLVSTDPTSYLCCV